MLLVEHDIDRVFQIADHVTVMNEGEVLVDGTVADARDDAKVREVYIGSGAAALASKPRTSAAGATPLLAVDKVDTFYGKSHILHGVSLQVCEHEIVALLGRNGAGKSTLLKSLIGIVPPSAGAVRLAGEEIAGLPADAIARRGIGYVPQGRALFAGMTVEQNLELGRLKRLTGNGIHWDEERILWFFPRLKERWRTPADYLSGGEQQMVAVARALAGDVRVLLARRAVRRPVAGGDRGAVRGLRQAALRGGAGGGRPPPRPRARAVRSHGGVGARRGDRWTGQSRIAARRSRPAAQGAVAVIGSKLSNAENAPSGPSRASAPIRRRCSIRSHVD